MTGVRRGLRRALGCALMTALAGCHVPLVTSGTGPAALVGPTWYLQSWTTSGHRVLPETYRPPTLVFDSLTAAHSDDPTNTTTWTVRLGQTALAGTEGPTTAVAEDAPTQAAYAAVTAVLSAKATWSVSGDTLLISGPSGSTLSYTKNAAEALALGNAYVWVSARGYQPYRIAGTVSITAPDGTVSTRQVSEEGVHLMRLVPGDYKVTAVVAAGSCTPASMTVHGGVAAQVSVACLLKDHQPAGLPTGIYPMVEVTQAGAGPYPGTGLVVIRDAGRAVVWRGSVSRANAHPIYVKPGRYSVTATVTDHSCSTVAVTVVLRHVNSADVVCRSR